MVWSRGSRLAERPALTPDAIRAAAPHLTVTTITPFGLEGPWCDRAGHRVHAAGLVRRDRRPGPRRARTGRRCSSAARSASGSPAPRPPSARWSSRARALARRAGRARRRVDARDARAVPHLLPGDLRRHGRTALPERAVHRHARAWRATSDGLVGLGVGTGQQWLDFCVMVEHPEWMEDRSLFANRAHLRPDDRRVDGGAHHGGDPRRRRRVPHPARPDRQRRDDPRRPTTSRRAGRSSRTRATASSSPTGPYRFDPPLLRAPEPAPTVGEHDGDHGPSRVTARAAAGATRGGRCRSRACASST